MRLLHALKRFGLPDHYLRVIEAIYGKLSFFVELGFVSSLMWLRSGGGAKACGCAEMKKAI